MLMFVFTISSYSTFAQGRVVTNNAQFTISKRLLSIEDGLASHEVFCGEAPRLYCQAVFERSVVYCNWKLYSAILHEFVSITRLDTPPLIIRRTL